jgi:hypothetical protein
MIGMINSKKKTIEMCKICVLPLISTVLSLDHPFCQGRLGRLTIDVKDDVVGFDVPMDVVQIGVDVVNGLSIGRQKPVPSPH